MTELPRGKETVTAGDITGLYGGDGQLPTLTPKAQELIIEWFKQNNYNCVGGAINLQPNPTLKDTKKLLSYSQRNSGYLIGPLVVGGHFMPEGIGLYEQEQAS